ncbi:MAG: arylsulfatase, partial [Myxococcales bacterium]|nr:arylsulfatase [Myxococcales bacterium]
MLLITRILLVLGTLLVPATGFAAERPNVVILLADDLGWADVGYRGSDIETPNIDALAAEGVRLERLYVSPICTPTRAALMTGRDPMRLGVAYFPLLTWSNKAVSPKERFLPEDFQAAGYQTGMVGKWHLGHTLEIQAPNARGFDDFFGHLHTEVKYWEHSAPAGGHDFQRNGKSVRREGRYLTDVHGEEAARFIKERDRSRPFFLYVPFLAPHSPMEAPKELVAKYADRKDPVQRVFAAMVDSMDQAVGVILDTLESEGLAENTIVVFLSDNGGPLMSGAQNTPLRGGKLTTFEGGVRVVGIIRWPG